MNDDTKRRRAAELGQLTSPELGEKLAAAGWRLTGRRRKQDKVSALLHLEGFAILPDILADLELEKLEPVAAASNRYARHKPGVTPGRGERTGNRSVWKRRSHSDRRAGS